MKVMLIGYGTMARTVTAYYDARGGESPVAGLLVLPEEAIQVRAEVPQSLPVITEMAGVADIDPDLVVECAGHQAVRQYGEAVLSQGRDLAVVSIGCLADAQLFDQLTAAAKNNGRRLLLPTGAVAGLDGLQAARAAGLDKVLYTGRKPPAAWKGTAAQDLLDLDSIVEPQTFFTGSAREAALAYPQNANVAATVAIAGIGFEETKARLIADPTVDGNIHHIEAHGATGRFEITLEGRPSPLNPKTSMLAGYSVIRLIEDQMATVVI